MSIAENLAKIAVNQEKVYDAGYEKGFDAGETFGEMKGYENANSDFWDVIQQNGTRTSYVYAFTRWYSEYIRPKHKVIPTEQGVNQVFSRCKNLKKVEAEYFDFSQIPTPTSTSYGNYYTFQFCYALEEIEDIGLSYHSYTGTFHSCEKLHTIAKLRVNENTSFTSDPFYNCSALENITIDGVIGQNGFDVHWSTELTHDSLMSIITALKDYSDSSEQWVVTLGTANLNKLSDAEKAIATEKGWTLAYEKGWTLA